MTLFLFPDMMRKQSLLLNFALNQFTSVTFAVIITYTIDRGKVGIGNARSSREISVSRIA